VAALEGMTLLARAFLASHVPLEFVNRRPLLAPHNVERDGLMRLAAKALHLKIAIARVVRSAESKGAASRLAAPSRRYKNIPRDSPVAAS